MPSKKRPRSDSEADWHWRNIETTTIPISSDLREMIRADLKKSWHLKRLELSRREVQTNWYTDDTHLVVLENETGTVKSKQLLLFCNKATAFFYLQTAQYPTSSGEKELMPGMIFSMIAREWLRYHNFMPNIEFGHYIANPVRVATGGPSDVRSIIEAHISLCTKSSELMLKDGKENLRVLLPRGADLANYGISPLYKAVIMLLDRVADVEPEANRVFDLETAIHSQSVLIARTGLEVGLSGPISFDSLKGKDLPLERSDVGIPPDVEVIRTCLADGIRFILDLEERESTAYPRTIHRCGSDQRLNPSAPTWAGKSADASQDPDRWADALVEAGDMYGYDEEPATWMSIRRVQAAMVEENFAELVPIPFGRKWRE